MFKKYADGGAAGWLGYFSDGDEITAFVSLDKRVVFVSEIGGWDHPDDDFGDDPDDWWKTGKAPPPWRPEGINGTT